MAALPFVDTNVFLRHLLQDHPDHSPRATLSFDRIEHGGLPVETTATVVFETVFTLQSFYKHPRPQIRDNVWPPLRLPGIALTGKRRNRGAFDLYTSTNLSFADCFHVAIAGNRAAPAFVSFDRGLDRIPGLNRVEPYLQRPLLSASPLAMSTPCPDDFLIGRRFGVAATRVAAYAELSIPRSPERRQRA